MRKALGIENGGTVVAENTDQGILIRPGVTSPIELYSDERIAEFDKAEAELAKFLKNR